MNKIGYEKAINSIITEWDGKSKEELTSRIILSLKFLDCKHDNCLMHEKRNAVNCASCVQPRVRINGDKYNIPNDMQEGVRHGLLTMTGKFKVANELRKYEAICDCGETVFKAPVDIRKRGYCFIKNHKDLRKVTLRKSRLDEYKEELIGSVIRNHLVKDVTKTTEGYTLVLECLHCGKTIKRNNHRFINEEVGGCNSPNEADLLKKKEAQLLRKQQLMEKNKGLFNYKNLTGRRFGKLTVSKYVGFDVDKQGNRHARFLCKCDCGGTWTGRGGALTSGSRKYCDKEISEINRQKALNTNKKKNAKPKEANSSHEFRDNNKGKFSEISKKVYYKYEGVCQACKTYHEKSTSQNHHIIPVAKKEKLAFLLSNCILLCTECHEMFHKQYGYVDFTPKDIFKFISERKPKSKDVQISLW